MSAPKLAIVGIDGFSPLYMDRFVREAKLPAIGAMANEGVTASLTSTLPATTPVAWTTVVTGCSPTVTGINGNLIHRPGDRLDQRLGCYAHRCQAEPLWETATLNAKRSYVVKFPVSYPSSTATFRLDGAAGWGGLKCLHELSSASTADVNAVENGNLRATPAAWDSAFCAPGTRVWSGQWVLDTLWGGPPVLLSVAVTRTAADALTVSIADGPDWTRVLAHVPPGEWSPVLTIRARGRRGEADYCFRVKVLDCGGTPLQLRLHHTVIHERLGHSTPDSLWQKYVDSVGPIEEQTDPLAFFAREIDLDTQLEVFKFNAEWITRASTALLTGEPWDLFIVQVHFVDWAHHMLQGALDPAHPQFRDEVAERYESVLLECYRMADQIVGDIHRVLGREANLVVLGDHGQDVHHSTIHMNEWLAMQGLLRWDGDDVDWTRTQVYAAGNYLYLNLEDREPTGIVPRRDAENVKARLIDALLALRDPRDRGAQPILAAGPQASFEPCGTSGPGVGDVIVLCRSGYQLRNNRGALFAPTRLFEEFTSGHDHFSPDDPRIHTRLFAAGPDFRSGYDHPTVEPLINVAPTICAALDMRPSPQCEGRPIPMLLREAKAASVQ